jgi:hypothetical protein
MVGFAEEEDRDYDDQKTLIEYLETESKFINYYKKIELVNVIRESLNKLIGYNGLKVEDDFEIISDERSALVRKMREQQKENE